MMKNWENIKILSLVFFLLSIALYFTWLSPIIKQSLKDNREEKLKKINEEKLKKMEEISS